MALIVNTADLTPATILTPDYSYWIYNGLDCCVTTEVKEALLPLLDEVTRPTYEFSLALQAPILEMSTRGILVNQAKRSAVTLDFKRKLAKLEEQLDALVRDGVGATLNWRSPKQLGELLYDIMGLPEQRKRGVNGMTRTSDRNAIEKLLVYFIAEPICRHLLLLRDLGKKISFLETGIDADGRMRTSFNIAGTVTGRLASSMSDFGSGSNLQNIDRTLKSIFIAEKGWKLANLDLEQADSRNIGAVCWNAFYETHGEAFAGRYLDTCESGDLHTNVCKMCNPDLPWGDDPSGWKAVAKQPLYRKDSYRDGAKKLGHGSNYLGTPQTMAKHTHFPFALVKAFQTKYFEAFPEIPLYHKYVAEQLKTYAFLTSLYGRRRFFFGRLADPATLREAVAFTGQSPTADAINIGLLNLHRSGRVRLLLQVHDSVLFAYREEEEDEILPMALSLIRAPLVLAGGREYLIPPEAQVGWNYGEYDEAANPDGLRKWPEDPRERTDWNWNLNLEGL